MPRANRVGAPGTVFHVIIRGNNKQKIFRTGEDLRFFCDRLRAIKGIFDLRIYAYCLMSNHAHIVVRQGSRPLGDPMKRLLTPFSQRFNGLYGHVGHVLQGRYKAFACLNDRYFKTLLRYVHLNPVAAKMVAKPSDWVYSGHRELLGEAGQSLVDVDFPLATFAEDRDVARAEYSDFLDLRPSLPAWQEAIETVCASYGVMPSEIAGSGRRGGAEVRRIAIRVARDKGAAARDIERVMGWSKATISRAMSEPANVQESLELEPA